MSLKRIFTLVIFISMAMSAVINSQTKAQKSAVAEAIAKAVPAKMGIATPGIKKFTIVPAKKTVNLDLGISFSYIPFTDEYIARFKSDILKALGPSYKNYKVNLTIAGKSLNNYKFNFEKRDNRAGEPYFVKHLNQPDEFTKGLDGNIIALWQSHGWYFEPKLNRWEWQRARIFQTVEDLYTQSYVMPFLMPMLENAGAYVMSPRERDTNINEIIIDNDNQLAQGSYAKHNSNKKWSKGNTPGFAYARPEYHENENPFTEGTYEIIESDADTHNNAKATWSASIPEDGEYAVYVSYATLPNSTKNANYTVNHLGGSDNFSINQTMGGGTWIYLGHFPFVKGDQQLPIVELTNYTGKDGEVVTADAVKIGGGMGNIARKFNAEGIAKANEDLKPERRINIPDIDFNYQISRYPRFVEGARYWLQWAGMPDSVYTPSENVNDYNDDYRSRGLWVNYLAGGSNVLPNNKGLNIPVDLAFAFHSDAGTTTNDSIIGTLGIYYTNNFDKYVNGTPRVASRKLTDYIMTNIVNDVRAQFEPNWMRRGMWDQSYFEARVPEVPTMLLELLSHQNFADMKYGLNPEFRFAVSRAIYKGMLQFLAERDGREYQVQPLPVNSFAVTPESVNSFVLSWKATPDTLTPGSDASAYYIYERINDGAFKFVAKTTAPSYSVTVNDNDIHSYRIVAVNDGGKSFPSETLALGVAKENKGNVMVVNGFTRISAPDWFDSGEIAGFYDTRDHGVPYVKDISFIGSMFEFRRDIPWMDDDAAGFGASRANYEEKVVAGNAFDYPYVHGKAIMDAGYSFVSSSVKAVESGVTKLSDYKYVDLILGKQKEVKVGRGAVPNKYRAFTPELQKAIKELTAKGGNIFVSGSYVATDIWDNLNTDNAADIEFARNVLGYNWRVGQASVEGKAYVVPSPFRMFTPADYTFNSELNEDCYIVESPDSFFAADSNGYTFMRYNENNLVAGVLVDKGYKTCVIGFPFETITSGKQRSDLMTQILKFFNNK